MATFAPAAIMPYMLEQFSSPQHRRRLGAPEDFRRRKSERRGCCLLIATVSVLPQSSFALTENFVPDMGDYVFYTFVISTIVFSSAILVAMRSYRWLVYALFASLLVFSNAASGGVISYILGPNDFNLFVVPYLVFSALTVYGLWMAGWLLDPTHKLGRLRRAFYVLAGIAAIGPVTSHFWLMRIPLNLMWIPEQILYAVMILGQILPPLSWRTLNPGQRRLILAFPVVIALFIVGSFGVSQWLLDISQEGINTLSRISIAMFVSFSLTLVLWQAFATTRAKEQIERKAIEAAKAEAELQLALARSEQQYARAQALAAAQRSQLAKVSHDLKQPISALRLAVDNLENDTQHSGRLNRAIDYVDQLAQSFRTEDGETAMAEGTPSPTDPQAAGDSHVVPEPVATELFAQSLRDMFAEDAQALNVTLTVRCQPMVVSVVPLASMRIMTNVVANAFVHAHASRILVGFRTRGERTSFEVYDNGVGMDEQALRVALCKGGKGDQSNGDGLGLSIVQDLCAAQGYPFSVNSTPGAGTAVRIELG